MVWSRFLEERKRQEQADKKISTVCSLCLGKYCFYNRRRHYASKKHKQAGVLKYNYLNKTA